MTNTCVQGWAWMCLQTLWVNARALMDDSIKTVLKSVRNHQGVSWSHPNTWAASQCLRIPAAPGFLWWFVGRAEVAVTAGDREKHLALLISLPWYRGREGPGLKQQCAVRQQIRESGCWVYKAKIICYYGGKEWPALSTWLLGGMFPEDKPLVDQEFLWLPEDQDFILRFIYVYFYVCGCFACVCCVSVYCIHAWSHCIHAWYLRKPGEGVGPSGTRVTDICEPPWMLGTESQYSTRTVTAPSSSQNLAFVFFFSV